MNAVQLNQRLEEARRAYYAGEPLMTDAEYDLLEAQLKGLSRDHPDQSVLTTVGTDTTGRIPHEHPMRSIENKYSFDEVLAWAKSIGFPDLTLSPKYDGVSCSLTYEKGELVKAVTRGDGDAGESILNQIRACDSIPKNLVFCPVKLEIRGELVIKRSTMIRLNEEIVANGGKPFVSTRNLVAGTIKLKDLDEVRKRCVQFMPWEVLAPILDTPGSLAEGGDSAAERLDLTCYGFAAPEVTRINPGKADDLTMALDDWKERLQEKDPEIGMDGVVIKVDSVSLRQKLGYGSKFANFQVAFKAQNAKTESVLKEVIWQVGRQGRLTPVGVIEPVVLAGATIERVTLNNLSWIREMGLKLGCSIVIMRSGDVIPKIVEVLDA